MDTIASTRAAAVTGSRLILALEITCRAALLFGLALLVVSWAGIIYRSSSVPSASIYVWPGGGHAYAFTRKGVFGGKSVLDRWLYPSDSMHDPSASQLKLQQGTAVFGPPHSLHDDISKKGEGRYSDWNGTIVFSMPDNTDPRLGGPIRVTETASPSWLVMSFVAFGIIILIFRAFIRSSQPMAEVAFALGLLAVAKSPVFQRIVDILVVVVLIAIPVGLFVWQGPGPVEGMDAASYIQSARQILYQHALWSVPGLADEAAPSTLLRLPGYPLFLAIAMTWGGRNWSSLVLLVQIGIAILTSLVMYRCFTGICRLRLLAFAGAVIWMVTHRAEFDRWLMTDSLYTSILTLVSLRLIWCAYTRRAPSKRDTYFIGAAFAAMSLVREFTVLIIIAELPLMLLAFWTGGPISQPIKRILRILTPVLAVFFGVVSWNYVRSGYAVFTTGAESTALFRLMEVQQHGTPVFTRDAPLDNEARAVLKDITTLDPAVTVKILDRLIQRYGLRAPDLAKLVVKRYFEVWLTEPSAMIREAVSNSGLVRWIMAPLGFQDQRSGRRVFDSYDRYFLSLFTICALVLPLAWLLIGIIFVRMRRDSLIVLAIFIYFAIPTLAYVAIHFEVRYALYAVGPLLAIPAITIGSAWLLARRLLHGILASWPTATGARIAAGV